MTAENAIDEAARRCFIDRHLSSQPAVFVEEFPTTEGDPIVTVWRTSDDGTLEVQVDTSRDTYGSGQWSRRPCRQLTTTFPNDSEPWPESYFSCATSSDTTGGEPTPASWAMPEWFELRSTLPLCGYEVAVDGPSPERRRCFVDAVTGGSEAELVVSAVGDDGGRVTRWFRSLGDGRVEVFEWQSGVRGEATVAARSAWLRYECTPGELRFHDDATSSLDGLLMLGEGDGCSADAAARTAAGGVDGPVVYAAPSASGIGEEALAIGIVQLVDGCLLLGDSIDASLRSTVVWAAGTRWDPVAGEVILPEGTRVPIGAEIAAGGGYHPAGGIFRFLTDPDALSTVARCAAEGDSDGVFVVQHPVDIEPQP